MGSQLNPGVHGHLSAKRFDMAWKPLEPPKARNKIIGYEDDATEETTPDPKPEPEPTEPEPLGPKPPEPRSPEPGSPEPMTTKSPTRPKTPTPSLSAAAEASPPSTEKSKLTEIDPERKGAAPSPQQDRVDPHSTPAIQPVPVGKVSSGAGTPKSQASAGRTSRSSRGRVGTPVPLSGDVPIDRTEHHEKPMETVKRLKERVVAAVGNHRMGN